MKTQITTFVGGEQVTLRVTRESARELRTAVVAKTLPHEFVNPDNSVTGDMAAYVRSFRVGVDRSLTVEVRVMNAHLPVRVLNGNTVIVEMGGQQFMLRLTRPSCRKISGVEYLPDATRDRPAPKKRFAGRVPTEVLEASDNAIECVGRKDTAARWAGVKRNGGAAYAYVSMGSLLLPVPISTCRVTSAIKSVVEQADSTGPWGRYTTRMFWLGGYGHPHAERLFTSNADAAEWIGGTPVNGYGELTDLVALSSETQQLFAAVRVGAALIKVHVTRLAAQSLIVPAGDNIQATHWEGTTRLVLGNPLKM